MTKDSWKIRSSILFLNVHTCHTLLCLNVDDRQHLLCVKNTIYANPLLFLLMPNVKSFAYILGSPIEYNPIYHGVKTAASIVVRGSVKVRVSGGSDGLKNTRIIEGT